MPAYNGKFVGNNAYIPSRSSNATLLTPLDPMKLLLHGDGLDDGILIPDSSIYNKVGVVNGGLVTKTNQSVFGGSSMYFNGTDAFLEFPANDPDFALGALDFCIDFRLMPEVAADGQIFQLGVSTSSASDDLSMGLRFLGATRRLEFYFYTYTTYYVDIFPLTSLILNTWTTVRIQRNDNVYVIFYNGTPDITSSPASNAPMNYNKNMTFKIGKYVNSAPVYFKGWIDEFRFMWNTNYGNSAYTPAAVAFPNP